MKRDFEKEAATLLKKLGNDAPFTDQSTLPFGKQYKDKPLDQIPATHLLWWLQETDVVQKAKLFEYIARNLPLLLQQAAEERSQKRNKD
jgi:hypothetical protein